MSTCDNKHSQCKKERCGYEKDATPQRVALYYQDGTPPITRSEWFVDEALFEPAKQRSKPTQRRNATKRKRKSAASLKVKRRS